MIDLDARGCISTHTAPPHAPGSASYFGSYRPALLALLAASLTAGCSLVQPGVSLEESPEPPAVPTEAPPLTADAGPLPSPADIMFQSTDAPPAIPPTAVNVFGEVDGVAPSTRGGQSTGLQQHTFVDEGYDAHPSVSPDGKWILFSSTRHSERSDIYIQRTDGLAVTQLTADDADDAYPRFSRDGRSIAFASNRAGNWDIYVMDADGNRVRQVTRSPAQELHPTFSPDGTRLAYSALGSRSGQWELWTVDLRNGERSMIGYGLFPDWSPRTDRNTIAFQRARQRGARWFSVWTLELVQGEARDITEVAYSGSTAIVAPAWNADGTRLAFCTIANPDTETDASAGKPTKSPRQDIWTINPDGSERVRITDGRGTNAMPTWSRDGRLYFVSDRAGSESIWSTATGSSRTMQAAARVGPVFPETAEADAMTATPRMMRPDAAHTPPATHQPHDGVQTPHGGHGQASVHGD